MGGFFILRYTIFITQAKKMKEQLLETWEIHNRMNLLLQEAITETGMGKTLSSRGRRTVYQQFIHMHNTRLSWLEISAKDIFNKYKVLDKPLPLTKKLQRAFRDSAAGIAALLSRGWDEQGKIKGFRKGAIPLLGYFISHESHHRGNILLTLKQCGEKIPEEIKWGLWEWEKA